jgi:ubiquinone/menaquinone biosynthesis C-methylase UbiE
MKNQEKIWDEEYRKKGLVWNKETKFLPKVLKNKEVLEIGVGNGKTLISILKQKPKKVVAVDFSSKAIEICKKAFGEIENVKFKKIDFLKMPSKEEFDAVVCYYFLNNLTKKERKLAVEKIFAVLKRGGKVLFGDFASGDFRENNKGKRNAPICCYFKEKELDDLFCKFSCKKIMMKKFKLIRKDPRITRRIFLGIITK